MKREPVVTFTAAVFPQFNGGRTAYRAIIDGVPYLWGRTKQVAREISLREYERELKGGRG